MQPTRERRGTTERRCSQATGTASLRPIRALTSDEIVTPARPPRDPPPPSRPLTRTQSASTATHGPLPARPDAAGPLPVSPRAHRDRPRPTELASLCPKKRANGGAHKHRHRPRTTKHPPSTDRAALSVAPQPIEHTAKHITSSHLPWGGRMTGREQPNRPAGSWSEAAALTTGARLVWGSAPRRVPAYPDAIYAKGREAEIRASSARSRPWLPPRPPRAVARKDGGVQRARPAAVGTDADHQAAATGSARRRVTGWPVRAARRWQRARS